MIKKYRLLKDTPESKVGTVFEFRKKQEFLIKEKDSIRWIPEGYYNEKFIFTGQESAEYFAPKLVENKPEWFKELKSMVTEDGKQIFEGEEVFVLDSTNTIHNRRFAGLRLEDSVYFSSWKKYEEYAANLKKNFKPKTSRVHMIQHKQDGIKAVVGVNNEILLKRCKENWNIISVRRTDDLTLFSLGDEVYFKNDSLQGKFWVIDNFFLLDDGILIARSKDNLYFEKVDENLHIIKKIKTLTDKDIQDIKEALKVSPIMGYNPIPKHHLLPEWYIRFGAEYFKKMFQGFNNKVVDNITVSKDGEIDYKFTPNKTSEHIEVKIGFDLGKEKDQSAQLFRTDGDLIICTNGDRIYGIAIQASDNDRWKEQILPFGEGQKIDSRKWFKDKEKANEYLIRNAKVFSVNDILNSINNLKEAYRKNEQTLKGSDVQLINNIIDVVYNTAKERI